MIPFSEHMMIHDEVIITVPVAEVRAAEDFVLKCLKSRWTSTVNVTARYDIADISTDSSIYMPSPEDLQADAMERCIVRAERRLRDEG